MTSTSMSVTVLLNDESAFKARRQPGIASVSIECGWSSFTIQNSYDGSAADLRRLAAALIEAADMADAANAGTVAPAA